MFGEHTEAELREITRLTIDEIDTLNDAEAI